MLRTFVKLLRNPVLSEILALREQVHFGPVFLRVQYHYVTLLMSLRPCSCSFWFSSLFWFRVRRCSGSTRCRCSCVSFLSCHGLQGVMGLVVPLFTEIGLRGLVRGLLGSGIKYVVFKEERLTGLVRRLVACPYQNHARVTGGPGLLESSVGWLCGLVRGSLGLAG